jgi:hypothetical protein
VIEANDNVIPFPRRSTVSVLRAREMDGRPIFVVEVKDHDGSLIVWDGETYEQAHKVALELVADGYRLISL